MDKTNKYSGTPPPVVVTAEPVSPNNPYDKPYSFDPNQPGGVGSGPILVELDTVELRHQFIRKVYSILSLQLLITFGAVAFFSLYDPAVVFVQENPGLFYGALIGSFVLIIILSCFSGVARSYPWGPLFLMLFTLCESLIVGMFAANFEVLEILIAVGAVFAIVVGLTIFACQTKYDFTGWGPYLLAALLVILVFMFVLIFVAESREVQIVYSVLVVLVFSMFVVYDTQLIIGGAHKYSFGLDDYVFAALNLYLDIINLFIYILILVGGGDR